MRFRAIVAVAVLAACSKADAPPADTSMVEAGPAPVSLASLSGMWNVNVMPADRDTVLTSYVLDATDSTAWKFQFAGRTDWIPMRVAGTSGDSLMTEAGPFESGIRAGQQVTVSSTTWTQDGKLMGRVVARYAGAGPDSVANLRSEGTRQ